jgi:hypothetical protein
MIHSGLSRLSNYETLVLPSIVMQDNQEALMITYASGGHTWRFLYWFGPKSHQKLGMWVSIIPVDWKQLGKIGKHFKTI